MGGGSHFSQTLPSAAGCAVTKHHHHRTRTNDPAVATLSARAPLLSLHPPPTRPLTHSHTPALRWASCCTQPAPPAPFLFSSLLHPPHHLPPSPPPYRRSLDFLVASVERPADESLLAKKKSHCVCSVAREYSWRITFLPSCFAPLVARKYHRRPVNDIGLHHHSQQPSQRSSPPSRYRRNKTKPSSHLPSDARTPVA